MGFNSAYAHFQIECYADHVSQCSPRLKIQIEVASEERKSLATKELESPTENKQALKKFIHRVKESVGIAQRTRYSDKLCDDFEQLDNYKQCLDRLNWSLCQAIQGNPSFRKHGSCLAPPPDEDEYELIAELLKNNDIFKDVQNRDTQVSLYEKQAVEHREFIKEARHALHHIRKFIVKDYPAIGIQRKGSISFLTNDFRKF
ncbi:unnamed protein product [Haemonchus placei]|uniref:Uncharacterized protein n=1 Tax=Haemonchus placei TaxID=6290 RepID=A0A0N4X0H3_HAEPC|nr:unnamed protein product [Haemonchus placei]